MTGLGKLAAPIVVGVMGNTGIYLVPLMLGAMVADRGFTEQQAGLVASADLAGYAAMAFVTAMFLIHRGWHRLVQVGIAIMILANLASIFVTSGGAFAAVRFMSGAGAGILAAIATVSLGRSETPDRGYGLLFAASLLFGSAGLWGLPMLLERTGIEGAYAFIVVLALLTGIVSRRLEQSTVSAAPAASERGGARRSSSFIAGFLLLAIALFWAQQNALYAYMERIGDASGLSTAFIGFSLGLANLSGFVGAALVAWMGPRFGRIIPLVVSMLLQLACLWLLSGRVESTTFLLGIGLVSLCWNVVNPVQIGILADVDSSGRLLALSSTVIGAGLATGPALGAAVLTGTDYSGVLWLCALLSVVSALLSLGIARYGLPPRPT